MRAQRGASICAAIEQESLMFVDANRAARLKSPDGELIAELGRLRAVPEHVAKDRDAWTRVDDKFYITVNLSA